jgi:hypothetical protein
MWQCILVIPAMVGSINSRIMVHAGLDKKQEPITKITRGKRAGDVAQAIEYMPSRGEALSLKFSIAKKFTQLGFDGILA